MAANSSLESPIFDASPGSASSGAVSSGAVSSHGKGDGASSRLNTRDDEFASAFHHAAIGMALISPQGRFLKVNRALCELSGYLEAELTARSWQSLTHPDDLEKDLAFVQQLLRGEIESYRLEKRYQHCDGSWIWTLLSVSLISDSRGRPLHFISQIQDISGAKTIETELKQRQRDLQTVLDTVPDVITRFDLADRVLYINAAAEAVFGWPAAAFLGKKLSEVGVSHEFCHGNSERIEQVVRARQSFTYGCKYQPDEFSSSLPNADEAASSEPTAEPHYFQVRMVPEFGPDGEVVSVLSVARDVSAFTQSQNRLMEMQRDLQRTNDQLALANRELEKLAHIDGLTDLKNRRSFDARFHEEIARARRSGETFSLAILDIDRFKEFNDTFGHVAGDETLRTVAGILESTLRPIDIIARYGGEEFTMILPATTVDGAMRAMERCRVAIAAFAWPQGKVTGSFGISTWAGEDAQTLLVRADVALYTAKNAGRNRVAHAGFMGENV